MNQIVIELTVNNHPGVLSRISGVFARRAFNLDGVLVSGLTGTTQSRMFLLVEEDHRLSQIVKQLEKCYDVLDIFIRHDMGSECFTPQIPILAKAS